MTGSARTRWTLCLGAKASIKGEGSGEGMARRRAGHKAGGLVLRCVNYGVLRVKVDVGDQIRSSFLDLMFRAPLELILSSFWFLWSSF